MIDWSEETGIWKLDTPGTTYLIGLCEGRWLGHLYYGERLQGTAAQMAPALGLLRTGEPPLPPGEDIGEEAGFRNVFPWEFPTCGGGDFHEGCLDVRDEFGQSGAVLTFAGASITPGKPSLEGLPASFAGESEADTLTITLRDEALGFSVELLYGVFRDLDVITRSVRVVNRGERALHLTQVLSAALSMDQEGYRVITMPGSWARERRLQLSDPGCGTVISESLRGEPSHAAQPFVGLVSEKADQESGRVYGLHLVYSGNFLGRTQVDENGMLRAVLGIHPWHFDWKLAPGESFVAPEVVCTFSAQGLGGMSRTLHDFYRRHLIRRPQNGAWHPILINSWEAAYFDFDEEKLLSLARTASAAGCDLLVVDDGWFGERDSDAGSLGDWWVNPGKLPHGLAWLSARLRELGMRLGLWFEPEMVSPDSDLFRAHPDWVQRCRSREPAQCRNQYVLDFSNPAVVEYICACMDHILDSADIAYVKWDMNRSLTDAGSSYLPADRQGEVFHRHVLGLYRIQEHLRERYPSLLLENCSSGGARFDPGMLYYSPQIWASDNMDPVSRALTLEGTALLYPLSVIGSHVCKSPGDIVGRRVPLSTRAICAMPGTFGYELDLRALPERERAQIPEQICVRRLLQEVSDEGDLYRIASLRESGDFDCIEVMAKDRSEGYLFALQVLEEPSMRSRHIRLAGLDPHRTYTVQRVLWPGEDDEEIPGQREPYLRQKREVLTAGGDVLLRAGMLLQRPKGDFVAELFVIRAVESGESRQAR